MSYRFIIFLTTAQLVRAGGTTCDKFVRFDDDTSPDFYAVQIAPERTYTLFHRLGNNIYKSENGSLLKSDKFGEWKICIMDNASCKDAFKQNSGQSRPAKGETWEDVSNGKKMIKIEIQDLSKCQEIRTFKIETTCTV